MKIGNVGAVMTFDSEVYLVVLTIINQAIVRKAAAAGTKHMKTPAVVANPFPPLKFNQIGQLWPHIATIPEIIMII